MTQSEGEVRSVSDEGVVRLSVSPKVPDLPAGWPPTSEQLAGLMTSLHWLLEAVAFDLPRGQVGRQRLDSTAEAMEKLAGLLRKHDVGR